MFVIKYKKIFFLISTITILASIFSIFYFGLNLGIDFKGGSLLEFHFASEAPAFEELRETLKAQEIGEFSLRSGGENRYLLRTHPLTQAEKDSLTKALSEDEKFEITEDRFDSIGPVIGSELKKKAWIAISITLISIVLYIAFVFRKVSKPISSWVYGMMTLVALVHDLIIPLGVFALLGYFVGAEVDVLLMTALLAILGYSISDTIVIFDRIRENLKINQSANQRSKEPFQETVGKSLNQTFARSFNTSFTTFLAVLSLFIFGGEITRNFALILIAGIIAGTYSSIFLASPLLVSIEEKRKKS